MISICLLLLMNTDNQKNYINVNEIAAIEDNVSYTKIYMNRSGLGLRTNLDIEKVVEKVNQAKAGCKL